MILHTRVRRNTVEQPPAPRHRNVRFNCHHGADRVTLADEIEKIDDPVKIPLPGTMETWQLHPTCIDIGSALTLLELGEMMALYASYENLAAIVRHRFDTPKQTLREMFSRMMFNILCGNIDDHARNHASFSTDRSFSFTPAYGVYPQNRTGGEATKLCSSLDRSAKQSHLVPEGSAHVQLLENDAIGVSTKEFDDQGPIVRCAH